MISGFSNSFDALFTLQRALEGSLASGWLGATTAGGDGPMDRLRPLEAPERAHVGEGAEEREEPPASEGKATEQKGEVSCRFVHFLMAKSSIRTSSTR